MRQVFCLPHSKQTIKNFTAQGLLLVQVAALGVTVLNLTFAKAGQEERKGFGAVLGSSFNEEMLSGADKTANTAASKLRLPLFTSLE